MPFKTQAFTTTARIKQKVLTKDRKITTFHIRGGFFRLTGEQGKVSKAIELDRNLDCQPILPIHKSWTLFNNNSLLSVRKHLL